MNINKITHVGPHEAATAQETAATTANENSTTLESAQAELAALAAGDSAPSETGTTTPTCHMPEGYNGFRWDEILGKWRTIYWNGKIYPAEGATEVEINQLAFNIAPLVEYRLEWLKEVVPYLNDPQRAHPFTYEEFEGALNSALKQEHKGLHKEMKAVLAALRKESKEGDAEEADFSDIPVQKGKLPSLLASLVKLMPKNAKEAGIFAALSVLSAYCPKAKIRHNGQVKDITFQILLLAPSHAGKSYVETIINLLIRPIDEKDEESRKELEKYNNMMTTKSVMSNRESRPTNICIRHLGTNFTPAARLRRFIDLDKAGGQTAIMYAPEIELIESVSKKAGRQDIWCFMRLMFDSGYLESERDSSQSVTGRAPAKGSCIFATTPSGAARFFPIQTMTDGTIDRILMATVIPSDTRPKVDAFDAEAMMQQLNPYLQRLQEAEGVIECKSIDNLIMKLEKECKQYSEDAQCPEYWEYAMRTLVVARRAATLLYIAEGEWNSNIGAFITFMVKYGLAVKLHFFGEDIRNALAYERAKTFGKRIRHADLLQFLPIQFSKQTFEEKMREQKREPKDSTLRSWLHRERIAYDPDNDVFIKTGK